MHWPALLVAGILEIVWVVAMKQSNGFTRVVPSIITACAAGASFWLLAYAMKGLPLGTSYAIWTGIGAALAEKSAHLIFKITAWIELKIASVCNRANVRFNPY